MAVSDQLEEHFYTLCRELSYDEFNALTHTHARWTPKLFVQIRAYTDGEKTRRPLRKSVVLDLRSLLLDHLDAKEQAMANMETIQLGEVLTDAQLQAAADIIDSGGPRVRDLIIREVLTMDPPAGVTVKKDEHGRIQEYGPFHPPYLAYAIMHAIENAG